MNKNESGVDVVTTENDNEDVDVQETETVVPAKPPIVETAEAKRARLKRQLKKVEQQLGISEEEVDVEPIKSFTLDRADKAFLNANGIKGKDEYDLVTDFARNTGKDIEEIIESKYFQSQIKEVRETRESRMASDVASGNNRTGASARDTVDYWIGKGELPPPYMKQLRRDVVNTRAKIDSDSGTFTSSPVVGG